MPGSGDAFLISLIIIMCVAATRLGTIGDTIGSFFGGSSGGEEGTDTDGEPK